MSKLCTLGLGGRVAVQCSRCNSEDFEQNGAYKATCNSCGHIVVTTSTMAPLVENVRRSPQ